MLHLAAFHQRLHFLLKTRFLITFDKVKLFRSLKEKLKVMKYKLWIIFRLVTGNQTFY